MFAETMTGFLATLGWVVFLLVFVYIFFFFFLSFKNKSKNGPNGKR